MLLSQAAFGSMAIGASVLISGFARTTPGVLAMFSALRTSAAMSFGFALAFVSGQPREDVYNILWAVVFGFATLNILGLASRRMEPRRRRMSFGELMAVAVVVVSLFLLGWEMLSLLHIFPIKLKR
jgi:membrane protein insertase Oxa1/YidC/SpoIIIJ